MCGIYAFLDSTSVGICQSDLKSIYGLMFLTSLRGRDSTAMIGINSSDPKNVTVHKVMGGPENLFRGKAGKEMGKKLTTKFHGVIGHGRKATIGSVNLANAHPFVWKHITLVHNGTYQKANMSELEKLANDNKIDIEGVTTDSELLTRLIAEIGPLKTLSHTYGAYALIWHDALDGHIYFCRNAQRPLSMLKGTTPSQFYLASEVSTLDWLKKFNNVSGTPESVQVNTLFKIDATKMSNCVKVCDIPFVTSSYQSGWKGGQVYKHMHNYSYRTDYDDEDDYMYGAAAVPQKFKKEEGSYDHMKKRYKPGDYIFFHVESGSMGFDTMHNVHGSGNHSSCINGDSPLYEGVQIRSFGNAQKVSELKNAHEHGTLYKGKIENIIETKTYIPRTGKNYICRVILDINTIEKVDSEKSKPKSTYDYVVFGNNKSLDSENFSRVIEHGCNWCKAPIVKEQSKSLYLLKCGELLCPECSANIVNQDL